MNRTTALFTYRWTELALAVLLSMSTLFLPLSGLAALKKETGAAGDGLVSIRCDNRPVLQVLDEIADKADLEIYLFDSLEKASANGEFVDEPVQNVLRRLLRGCDYAVIYASGAGDASGVRLVEGGTGASKGRVSSRRRSSGSRRSVTARRQMSGTRSGRPTPASARGAAPMGSGNASRTPVQGTQESTPGTWGTVTRGTRGGGGFMGGGGNSGASDSAADSLSAGSVDSVETPGGTTGGTSASGVPGQPSESAGNRPVPQSPGLPPDRPDPYSQPGDDTNTNNPAEDGVSQREAFLNRQIGMLESRIANGASDRDYAKWSSIKGEKYVTHDSERLQYYQNELDALYRN